MLFIIEIKLALITHNVLRAICSCNLHAKPI